MTSRRPVSCNLSINPEPQIIWNSPSGDASSDSSDSPIEYRIEERRRTLVITTKIPPDQWDPATFQNITRLSVIPEDQHLSASASPCRRANSCPQADSNQSADPSQQRVPAPELRSPNNPHQHNKYSAVSVVISPVGQKYDSFSAIRQRSRRPPPAPPSTPLTPTPTMPTRPKIYFYDRHDPHYGFTNFSPHTVAYKGKTYPTSEHLFQSFKFMEHRPLLAEHIRTFSDRPSVALSEARRFQPEVRPDWMKMNVAKMEETLWHKFNQHTDLMQELLDTGDAELIEDSDKDSFWGVGADRKGRNELGKALEKLRSKLRRE